MDNPQWPVLAQFYDHLFALSDYLDALISSKPHEWCTQEDDDSFRHLITNTVVASPCPLEKIIKSNYYPPQSSQSEILDRVHGRLFKTNRGKPTHILALGYRMTSHRDEPSKLQPGREGISNFATNSMVETLRSTNWKTLLQRIGDAPMYHLLTSTSIFLDLGNGNLCQATGTPLHELVPLKVKGTKRGLPKDIKVDQPLAKRQRTNSTLLAEKPLQFNFAADINFARNRIFYAKPTKHPSSSKLHVGLPLIHVLNRIGTSDQDNSREEDARLLSKYIFPRQYQLHNVFCYPKERTPSAFRDYTNREQELMYKGPVKTPLRLKQALPLICHLIHRHSKTNYHAILERVCKSKLEKPKDTPLDSSVILELMSETSEALPSQMSLARLSGSSSSTSSGKARLKPKFAQFICSHREVSTFAVAVTSEVIPEAFWGSEANYKQIVKRIKEFVQCRRFETISLHRVIQGLKFSEVDWAFASSKGQDNLRRSATDATKSRELIEEFLYWYFDSFLIPLLRTTFYCTESAAFQKRVLFFRQDDWKALCQPLIDKLCSETFEMLPQVGSQPALEGRKLGFSNIRLLPKETGVRPIVNLGRKPMDRKSTKEVGPSINQMLQAAFSILTFERDRHPHSMGATVQSHNHFYAGLKGFKQRHITANGKLPKLYFVKLDVRACFDTIEQGKLLEIVKTILEEDAYTIQRFSQVATVTGTVKKNYVRRAIPDDEDPHFLSLASKLATSLRHNVFSDQVVYGQEDRERLLELLEEHITSNVVKIGDQFYKQRVGIPQGSILSTILCNFFYGDLEKTNRFDFTRDPSCLLMRYVDDYFFVSTQLSLARQFLAMMNKGHPEYGCFISQEKTMTNFDHGDDISPPPCDRGVAWCGMMINTRNLNVTVDYSRFANCDLGDTLTIGKGRLAGSIFKNILLRQAAHRAHIIFIDTTLNSCFTSYLNIYENYLLIAMKAVRYLEEWAHNREQNERFAFEIICQIISAGYIYIASNSTGHLAKRHHAKCAVQKLDIIWLGFHAFHAIFLRRRAQFGHLVYRLSSELIRCKRKGFKSLKKLERVMEEGTKHFKDIRL